MSRIQEERTVQDPTELGRNRTGLQMSPLHAELQVQGTGSDMAGMARAAANPESLLMAEMRREYVNEADALGSVPPPGTVKGVVKAGASMLTGNRAQVLVDKLAERLAFERGGTRLYDAILVKAVALAEGTPVSVERLKQIRTQEAQHANLLADALRTLGADPTAQTPCADLVGVETMGLLQAVTDPRTTLAQSLHAALAAELVDVAGWELLAKLARQQGHDNLAQRFEVALGEENSHLESVKSWEEALVSADARVLS